MKSNYIGLSGYRVHRVERVGKVCQIQASYYHKPAGCPRCGGRRLVSKGPYHRKVRHLESFGQRSVLHINLRRWLCKDCQRSFVPSLPGIRLGHHSTEPFRRKIFEDHHQGICASQLAEREAMGAASVGRIYAQFTHLKAQERRNQPAPSIIGIDEHTLHRGRRLVTTFCNLKNRKVFDVVQGRSQSDLLAFLLSLKGRHKVKVVCIDLCTPYRQMIARWFPNAKIVADRFHVIRIIQHHFLSFCRKMAPQIKHQRGLLASLRRNPENLTDRDHQRLEELFQNHPVIKELYERQLRLRSLLKLKTLNKQACKEPINQLLSLLQELKDSGLQAMKTLCQTLENWKEEIVRMWRFSRNNGITEGYHRKMKLIQRRAYGLRNFENYRLRVIAQCG